MKEYSNVVFYDSTVLEEDILVKGSIRALKNLETKSITIDGSLEVREELNCHGDLQINGFAEVGGKILAEKIIIYGDVVAKAINGEIVRISGNAKISQEIKAAKSAHLVLTPRKREYAVNGWIEAPEIILQMRILYSKLSRLPGKILKRLGRQKQFKKEHVIKNLKIRGKKLVLASPQPPDRVNYEFVNCEINVQEKEFIQMPYELETSC
ncbi:MAG: hypothetical protein ACFFB3_23825 [Candidatus Hodarchaeota archaeon]